MGRGRKMKFNIPLSISATSAWIVTHIVLLILLVETGLCSDSAQLTPSVAPTAIAATTTTAASGQTRHTGPSGIDSSSSSVAATDSETSESQSEPSAFDLVAEWASNNEPLDPSNPVVSSIATMLSGLGVSGLGLGSQQDDHEADDISEHEQQHVEDHSDSNDLQTGETISHFFPSPAHHLKHEVQEPRWSFWDWFHSDGTYVVVVLVLFGVIPILIGLLPYFLIASNFWFIFYKIHSLHAAFLDILHNPLDSHDSHHVGYDYGGGGGGEGWEGWRHLRG